MSIKSGLLLRSLLWKDPSQLFHQHIGTHDNLSFLKAKVRPIAAQNLEKI